MAELYPALAFQVSQSLKSQSTNVIQRPFVVDVFLLDTLTETLATPLRLLSYAKLRVAVSDKLKTCQQLTVLSYRSKRSLWLGKAHQMVMFDYPIVEDLDAAMLVRRDNQPGEDTPASIFTRMRGTRYESLSKKIETRPAATRTRIPLAFHG